MKNIPAATEPGSSFTYIPQNARIGPLAGELCIPSELSYARQVEQNLIAELRKYKYPEDCLFAVRLSLEEALSNAIKHGNRFDPDKEVTVRFSVGPEKVKLVITDQGCGFDPVTVPDPTTDEHLEDPNGRGIMLIRAYMDEVFYNEQGNEVRMVKWIVPSEPKQGG